MRRAALGLGALTLGLAWLGPLPAAHGFSPHMLMHLAVVAVAAPLLALGLAGSAYDPARRRPALFAPAPASLIEMLMVWGWHAPTPHLFARHTATGLVLEQASFLLSGLLVWLSALGGEPGRRSAAGVGGLLLTSMHMTLLGVLLALAPRPLYPHGHAAWGLSPLADQQLGGVFMLTAGGSAYLIGALYLLAGLLRERGDDAAAG